MPSTIHISHPNVTTSSGAISAAPDSSLPTIVIERDHEKSPPMDSPSMQVDNAATDLDIPIGPVLGTQLPCIPIPPFPMEILPISSKPALPLSLPQNVATPLSAHSTTVPTEPVTDEKSTPVVDKPTRPGPLNKEQIQILRAKYTELEAWIAQMALKWNVNPLTITTNMGIDNWECRQKNFWNIFQTVWWH